MGTICWLAGLLLSFPNTVDTKGYLNYSTEDLQPLYNKAAVHIQSGNPEVVASPVGPALHFTRDDVMTYDFQFNEPTPCPFDLSHCQEGLTLSLWFRWVEDGVNKYHNFLQLGTGFRVYKAPYPDNKIRFRWISGDSLSWFNFLLPEDNVWHHMTATWQATHTAVYMDGSLRKMKSHGAVPKTLYGDAVMFGSIIEPSEFSTSPIYAWNEAKSPAFIWRLYQDALPKFQNWSLSLGN